jgi:hypothetical protein
MDAEWIKKLLDEAPALPLTPSPSPAPPRPRR